MFSPLPTTLPSLSIAMDLQHANPDLCSVFTDKEGTSGYPMCTLSLGPAARDDDGTGSIISMSATVVAACEGSGSNSSGALPMPPAKRLRTESAAAAATGAPSARFKGVVLQQNGHWGAQIYAHHSRIWLGTFKTDSAAARAYDSAAAKLHRGDAHRNFPTTTATDLAEQGFQNMFSTEAVLGMIRDGSYEPRLAEYLWTARLPPCGITEAAAPPVAGVGFRELFQKELTPSDVGKLNRLVIPKKYATKCLPVVSEQAAEEVVVEFMDRESRMWTFRYCYWKSSQSYVFTKGWNKFVKDRQLKAKDVVAFYHCEEKEGLRREYRMIDVLRNHGGAAGDEGLGIRLGREVGEEEEGEVISGSVAATTMAEGKEAKKPLMLFGVCIEEKL